MNALTIAGATWRRLGPIVVRPGTLAIADQALISATNFLVLLLVARQIGPAAFGVFVIAWNILLFANGMQSALFTRPHNVLGSRLQGHEYARYTTAVGVWQAAFAVALVGLLTTAGLVLLGMGVAHAWTVLMLAPACLAWQLQEFARRVMYTQFTYSAALVNDILVYGCQVALIALLALRGDLQPVTALAAVAGAYALGAALAAWQLRALLHRNLRSLRLRSSLSETWAFSRWLLGSAMTAWAASQLFPILTAGLVGTAATGGLRAAVNLVAPTHVLMKSMESVLPSKSARSFHRHGMTGLDRTVRRFALPAGLAFVAWCVAASLLAKPALGWLFGPLYEPYWWLVPILSVAYVLEYLSSIASIVMSSVGRTRPMFIANAISAVMVLTLGVLMVSRLGLLGTAIGMVAHGIILNVVLWRFVRQEKSST